VATGGSRKGPGERLDSIDSLRRRVPTIVKRLNDDPALALRAAANPLLVLQEMGIALTERLAAEVELRLRFRPEQIERLQQLRAEIQKHAGEAFDLDDPAQVRRVLFDHLKLSPLPPPAQPVVIAPSQVAKVYQPLPRHELEHPWTAPGSVRRSDPLERLHDAHPVMRPLLEYRALQASQPPLARRELVDRLTSGDAALPKIRIRARLQRDATPE
jgi:hypothetical protein